MWQILLVVILILLIGANWLTKHEQFDKIPGPKGILIIENALDFLMDPVKLFYHFRKYSNKYKEVFRLKLGPKKMLIIVNPEDVETLISGTKYSSKGFLYDFFKPWLNDGLLLSDGEKWRLRRKILTPAFHFNILRNFKSILEENSWKFAERLDSELENSKTNISTYISDFTLQSICETSMGTKLDEEASDIGRSYKNAIYKLGKYIVYRAQRVWMYPDMLFPYTIVGRKQERVLNIICGFRDSVINKRRKMRHNNDLFHEAINSTDKDDSISEKRRLVMLDLLLQGERDGIIDAKGIGEEVDTFMFEGHDTTAAALQFTFMILANYPESQEKILEEYFQIFGSTTQDASVTQLQEMKYTESCIKEALRLYPPVHVITRTITEPIKLKNYEAPADTECVILIYDLQRRNDQFVEPQEFRPERFMTEPTWHPYSYIPFSAGPRNCIGQKFAMIEMKLAITAILRRFKLLPVTKPQDIIFVTDFILRPKQPIFVKFEKRK